MKVVGAVAMLALAGSVAGQEMERLMKMKLEHRAEQRAKGAFNLFDHRNTVATQSLQKCVNGKTQSVAGQPQYGCDKVDLHGFISHADLGSSTKEGNDLWGWTSPDGRELVAVGQTDGTAFVEVKSDGTLSHLGRLPTQTESSPWRDMKVIDGYVYIGSEAQGHGLQVFDMRKLLKVTEPVTFDINSDLTAWYQGFGSSHNIVAHAEAKMIYAVGTSRNSACRGGLYMLDVSDPANPTSPGCANMDGYVHDAQCVYYNGPDAAYLNHEICFGYDESKLTIFDVTDKKKPVIVSTTDYPGASYTHQGWLTSMTDMSFLLSDDELDEKDGAGVAANGHTTTYIWNITSLEAPVNTGTYQSPVKSIDHNQYVVGGLSYQSNYGSGLRIVDISSIAADPTGAAMHQAAFFDCYPEDDAQGGVVEFDGSWSVYPFFKSGYLLLNSIERGIFSLKYTG